jgi:plastocyanin
MRSHLLLAAVLATSVACGSGNDNPNSPTPPGAPGPSGATITILANGTISPSTVDINVGQSVTVINQDSRNHELSSDPHPSHSDCPQFVVLKSPGQTKISNALPTAKTCGIHDHLDPTNVNLLGQIRVH